MTVPIVVTTEDQIRALGLVMAHVEHPVAGTLPSEYVDHLCDAIEERGPVPIAHALVTLATTFVLNLADEWKVPSEVVIRRTAVALANDPNPNSTGDML